MVDAELGIGLVFKNDQRGFYRVTKVTHGGPAYRSKSVREGDILLVINGHKAR